MMTALIVVVNAGMIAAAALFWAFGPDGWDDDHGKGE
jgi:nitrogen fixation-related uncharacterized protein